MNAGEFVSKELLAWVTGIGDVGACGWCGQPMDGDAVPLKVVTGGEGGATPFVAMCGRCQERHMPADIPKNRRLNAMLKAQVVVDLADNGLLAHYGLPSTTEAALEFIGLTPEVLAQVEGEMEEEAARRATPVVRDGPKVGRNDTCPCGSGRKYKRCCGAN